MIFIVGVKKFSYYGKDMPRHGRPRRSRATRKYDLHGDGSLLNFEDTPVSSPRRATAGRTEYDHDFGLYRFLITVTGLTTGIQAFRTGLGETRAILEHAHLRPRPYRHRGFAVPVLPENAVRKAAETSQEFRHLTPRQARVALLGRLPDSRRHTLAATFRDVVLVGGETDETNVYGVGLLLKNKALVNEHLEAARTLADLSGTAIIKYHIHREEEDYLSEMPLFLVDRKPSIGTLEEVQRAIGNIMTGQDIKFIYRRPG